MRWLSRTRVASRSHKRWSRLEGEGRSGMVAAVGAGGKGGGGEEALQPGDEGVGTDAAERVADEREKGASGGGALGGVLGDLVGCAGGVGAGGGNGGVG